jgi:hypothetical protein
LGTPNEGNDDHDSGKNPQETTNALLETLSDRADLKNAALGDRTNHESELRFAVDV